MKLTMGASEMYNYKVEDAPPDSDVPVESDAHFKDNFTMNSKIIISLVFKLTNHDTIWEFQQHLSCIFLEFEDFSDSNRYFVSVSHSSSGAQGTCNSLGLSLRNKMNIH